MNLRPLLLGFSILIGLLALQSQADPMPAPGLIVLPSHHAVGETVDRLESIVTKKGITVFARIDHAAGADKVGIPLRPLQLLVIGNPKLGSRLMTSNPTAAIDLPMKFLVWEDAQGKVWIGYNDPAWMAKRHGIQDREAVVNKMSGALAKFAKAAASP